MSVRTFTGEVLGQSLHSGLGGLFEAAAASGCCPLMGTVDPYDDTVFNGLQVSTVLAEIEALVPSLGEGPVATAAGEWRDLALLVSDRPHRYLVVSGD